MTRSQRQPINSDAHCSVCGCDKSTSVRGRVVVSVLPTGELTMLGGKVLFTLPECAELLSMGRSHLYEYVGRDLPVCRIGRSLRVHITDLLQFAESQRQDSHGHDGKSV